MLRSIYSRLLKLAETPAALPILAAVSFAESSFFPIPPDVMLIPMALARSRCAFLYAAVATLASLAGGLLGYAIGYYFHATIGMQIVHFYKLETAFQQFQESYSQYGWWIIVAKGATPIPYKVITIASGIAHFPLLDFLSASAVSRSMRFFLIAALLYWFGKTANLFIERYLGWVTIFALIVILGGFFLVKLI